MVVPVFRLPRGPWTLSEDLAAPGVLGVLMLDGLAGAYIGSDEQTSLELVGADDLLQPWVSLAAEASTPTEVRWQVFAPARVCILGREAVGELCAFPEVVATLMTRLVLRSRRLAFQLAVRRIVQVDQRLHLMLWHYADRWGRMTAQGVALELPLTHQQLAHAVGTRRPTLTSAVGTLSARGKLSRGAGKCWILQGEPPALYQRLRRDAALVA